MKLNNSYEREIFDFWPNLSAFDRVQLILILRTGRIRHTFRDWHKLHKQDALGVFLFLFVLANAIHNGWLITALVLVLWMCYHMILMGKVHHPTMKENAATPPAK